MKVAYLDCSAGVAGDMLLGALIDAGADRDAVAATLSSLGVDGWELSFDEVMRGPLRATRAVVKVEEQHHHRGLSDIRSIIDSADLDARITALAVEAFTVLARAEAAVHGTTEHEVHFHEVGALDAIIDIVGAAAALVSLEVDVVICSPVALGSGRAETMHGKIPVPGPAVIEMMKGHPVAPGGEGERATPTGVALVVAMADRFGPLPAMTLDSVGHGAGARDTTDRPNVVRVLVGTADPSIADADHVLLETNIDDMNPELVPYVIERLLAAGAQDSWVTPILMKKGRPGFTLTVLTDRDLMQSVLDVLYAETTTLGVRVLPTAKDALERGWRTVDVDGYQVRLKIGTRGGRVVNVAPEYEDAAKVARITGRPLKDVYRMALAKGEAEDGASRFPQD